MFYLQRLNKKGFYFMKILLAITVLYEYIYYTLFIAYIKQVISFKLILIFGLYLCIKINAALKYTLNLYKFSSNFGATISVTGGYEN